MTLDVLLTDFAIGAAALILLVITIGTDTGKALLLLVMFAIVATIFGAFISVCLWPLIAAAITGFAGA